jgi:hypothetical protein
MGLTMKEKQAVTREYVGYDRLEGFEEQALLPPSTSPWFPS